MPVPRFLLFLLLLLLPVLEAATAAEQPPNILWFTAEDMSASLGCYGDDYARTPHIDKLAKESVRYTNAFATAPVCSPARSCLITGVYATTLGTQRLRSDFPLPPFIRGWPSFLRKAGYYTTNNVKTDYNTSSEKRLIDESWDESSAEAHWRKRPDPGQPFFHVFNDMTTHQSRSMVWPHGEFVAKVQSQLEAEEIHDPATAPVPPYYPDTPVVRKTVARNYDCITAMDKHLGGMLEQLEEDGLSENTIVFFFSDHGAGLPRHKRALYDSGMHVPLLIRFPEKWKHLAPAKPGESLDRLVSFVDFPPTVLSLLDMDIPSYMQGVPFLGGQQGEERKFVYGARDRVDEVYDVARSIRTKDHLYIRNFMPHLSWHQPSIYPDQGRIRAAVTNHAKKGKLTPAQRQYAGKRRPVEELYLVGEDPLNLRNVINDPQSAAIRQTMRDRLAGAVVDTRDLGFLPEDVAVRRTKGTTPIEAGADPEKYHIDAVFGAALKVGDGSAFDEQVRLLRSGDAAVRYWATVGLAASQKTKLRREPLESMLKDGLASVRIEAASALRMPQLLADELQSARPEDVLRAIRALELLNDPSEIIRPSARDCLAKWAGRADTSLALFIKFSCEAILGIKSKY